jgi:hypothetical protein
MISILLFSSQAFAIDFRDSTGYTPSWALGKGYHSVLLECTEHTSNFSKDGDWCMEWMAYVLDQGIENFPESTAERNSDVTFDPNDLVKGDLYDGPLLKYLSPDSYYEKTWDPNLDNSGWMIGKPFTLPLNDDVLNAGIRDIVMQGVFVPDIYENHAIVIAIAIFEFDSNTNANNYFKTTKTELENKIKSDRSMEDISRQGTVFYDDCIAFEKNFDLADESSRFVCVKDKYLVSTSANQFGGYVTDNSYDYVLPNEVAGDISAKIGKTIDIEYQQAADSKTGGVSIYDEKSCLTLISGASWNPTTNSCVVKSLSIKNGETFTVGKGIVLINSNGYFKNSGTFNVLGMVDNWGTFENFGTINILFSMSINDNKIINKGTIDIKEEGSLVVMSEGTLENYGVISNNDDFVNFGEIKNFCDGEILGNPIGNDFGTGKKPAKEIPCETTSNLENDGNTQSGSDSKQTTEEKEEIIRSIIEERKTNSETKNSQESDIDGASVAFGAFIVFGIPAIIIGLIILKIKRGKAKKQEIRDSKWKGV